MEAATNGISQSSAIQQQQQQVVLNISGNRVGLIKEVVASGQTIVMERRSAVPITVYQQQVAHTIPASTLATSRPSEKTNASGTNIIVVNSRDASLSTSGSIAGSGGIVLLTKESPVGLSASPQTRVFSLSTASNTSTTSSVVGAASTTPKPTIIIGGPRAAQFNLSGTRIVSPSAGYLQQQQQQTNPQLLHRIRPPSPLKVLQASSASAASMSSASNAASINRPSKLQPSYLPSTLSPASIGIASQQPIQQQSLPPVAAPEVVIGDNGIATGAQSTDSITSSNIQQQLLQFNASASSRRKQRLLEGNAAASIPSRAAIPTVSTTATSASLVGSGQSAGSINSGPIAVRCICQYSHDDGNCVQCVACHIWQHVDCMMLRAAESESLLSYQCEQCQPRPVNAARAMRIQTRKLERLRDARQTAGFVSNLATSSAKIKPGQQASVQQSASPSTSSSSVSARPSSKYREARECVYTDKFNRRFHRLMIARYGAADADVPLDHIDEEDHAELLQAQRCRVVPPGRLEATLSVAPGEPIIEYRGRVCLPDELPPGSVASRFVLYYDGFDEGWSADGIAQIGSLPLVAIDASNLGNDARYARRSCRPNCSVRHMVLAGRPHLVLVATERLRPGAEITLPFDFDYQLRKTAVLCACSLPHGCPVRLFFQRLQQNAPEFTDAINDGVDSGDDNDNELQQQQSLQHHRQELKQQRRRQSSSSATSSTGGAFDDLICDIHASAIKKRSDATVSSGFKKPGGSASASTGKSQKANRSISFDSPASTKTHSRQISQPEVKKSGKKASMAANIRSISVDQATTIDAASTSNNQQQQQQGVSNMDREERWMQAMLKRIETMEKRQRAAKRQRQRSVSDERAKSSAVSSPTPSGDTEEQREPLTLPGDDSCPEIDVKKTDSKEPDDVDDGMAVVPKRSPLKSPTTTAKPGPGRKAKQAAQKIEEISFDEFIDDHSSASPSKIVKDAAESSSELDHSVENVENSATHQTPSKRSKSSIASSSPIKSPTNQPHQATPSNSLESASSSAITGPTASESREDRILQMYIKRIEKMEIAKTSRKRQKSSTSAAGTSGEAAAGPTSPSPKKPRPLINSSADSSHLPGVDGSEQRSKNKDVDDLSSLSSDDDSTNCLDDDLIARERRERREAKKSPRHRLFHSPPPHHQPPPPPPPPPPPQILASPLLSNLSSSMTASSRSPMKTSSARLAEEALAVAFASPIKPSDTPLEPQCDRIIYTEDCVDPFAKHMRRQVSEPAAGGSSGGDGERQQQQQQQPTASVAASASAKKRWLSKAIRDYEESASTTDISSSAGLQQQISSPPPMPPPPPPPPSAISLLASPDEMPLKKRLRAVHSCEETSAAAIVNTSLSAVSPPTESQQTSEAAPVSAKESNADLDETALAAIESSEVRTVRTPDELELTNRTEPLTDLPTSTQKTLPPPPPLPSLPPPLPPLSTAALTALPPPSSLQSPTLLQQEQPLQQVLSPVLPPPTSLLQQKPTSETGVGEDVDEDDVNSVGRPRTPCSSPPYDDDDAVEAANQGDQNLSNEEFIDQIERVDEDEGEASWSANRPKTPDTEPPDDDDLSAAVAAAASVASADAQETLREIIKRDQEIRDMQELAALERRKTKLMYQLRYVEQKQKKHHHQQQHHHHHQHSGSGGSNGGEASSSAATSRRVQVVQPLVQQQQQTVKHKQQLPSSSGSTARNPQQPPPNLSDLQQMLMNTINKLNEQLHAVVASGSGTNTASGPGVSRSVAPSGSAASGAAAISSASTSFDEKPTVSGGQKPTGSMGQPAQSNSSQQQQQQQSSKKIAVRGYGLDGGASNKRPPLPPI